MEYCFSMAGQALTLRKAGIILYPARGLVRFGGLG